MITRFQTLLQWIFMHTEALFNRAFGDQFNPLYHLGAITFFLFWVVSTSGIYLYAFFETGVADAYASVESITHLQWFFGGILRSIHRYASDAMVLTMLLHMVRYFAFDRFRGFRWFSWITGVALIWLIYISGINGFMLPWDKLAQFVIVTSFEWLDSLPSFGGTLNRNFIYPSSVTDRFFSLLAFMHIGISLVVLLVMLIHIQRVPKAKTTPPKAIVISLLVSLLSLSLIKPILSQIGPANLSVAVSQINLDWFYLAIFPLLYEESLLLMWGLVIFITITIAALPWTSFRLNRQARGVFQMIAKGSTVPITIRTSETLLDAGLRQGMDLLYECRNGGCGICICTITHGEVNHGLYQRSVLTEAMRSQGKALMCCATPLSNLAIEVNNNPLIAHQSMKTYTGQVKSIERISPNLIILIITLPDEERIDFIAGQYINIILEDGRRRAFSFANSPHNNSVIELHIRRIPNGFFTNVVFTELKVGNYLQFEGPLGKFKLNDSKLPIIFIAASTGFGPIKSIIEDAFYRGITRPMWLYWGVRKLEDLYMLDLLEDWERENPHFHAVPVISEAISENVWLGRQGLVHEVVLQDFPNLIGHEMYVCGSLQMVDCVVPAFIAQGLEEDACFSDVFLPSKSMSV